MPIYDYVCSSCATRTEFIHGIDAPPPRFCPACGAEDTLRKAFVAPTVHFKGSGWAKKDRSSSGAAKTKAAAGAGGDAKGGASDSAAGGKSDGGSSTSDGSKADRPSSSPKPAASSPGEG